MLNEKRENESFVVEIDAKIKIPKTIILFFTDSVGWLDNIVIT